MRPLPWPLSGRVALAAALLAALPAAASPRSREYAEIQEGLARGWNTWDTTSVTAQALLPEGFTLRVGLRHNTALNQDAFLADAQIGLQGKEAEVVVPGPHTWDGSYTELKLSWKGHALTLRTAHAGKDLVMLATPDGPEGPLPPTLVVSAGILWGRPGGALRSGDHIEFQGPERSTSVYWTGASAPAEEIPVDTPYFAALFTGPVGISTGRPRTVAEIRAILDAMRPPPGAGAAQAIETVLGWDTIYDPEGSRVISPVSRIWSTQWGGYVLFDWDTFFAATLASTGSRGLAYANAVEMLREETPEGFVPNYARPGGWKSFDRSEPPVGSVTVLGLYGKFGEAWFLRDTFGPLLAWNRWWDAHRSLGGYLVLGSDAGNRPSDPDDKEVGTVQGARFESGLDNSPMYDDPPFAKETGRIRIADVGLMGLYVADCNALADIAGILKRPRDEAELRARSARYGAALGTLWDEPSGMFLNRNLDTGKPSPRLSPTHFYPLLSRVPTARQADRMVREHLMNPAEFWGEWVIPSIARGDPAFPDQVYWRGRIWGPMNYLVYLGLQGYDQPEARRRLAEKSQALFEREWTSKGHVHENYNALTGDGDDVSSSDRFYHWGALLGYLGLLEAEAGPHIH
jgi:hypothetical protein